MYTPEFKNILTSTLDGLRADAGLSLGNDGIEEADGVHSLSLIHIYAEINDDGQQGDSFFL